MTIFYIASNGHAATTWIATMLNRHPEVHCWHSRCNQLFNCPTAEVLADNLVQINEVVRGSVGAVHVFPFHSGNYIERAITNVGGRFAFIVRNPVNRINSIYLTKLKKGRTRGADYDRYIQQVYGGRDNPYKKFENDDNFRLFANLAIECVSHDKNNFLINDGYCIQFEKVTSSKKYFLEVFRYLTGGQLEITEAYMDAVDIKEVINKQTNYLALSEQEAFESWPVHYRRFLSEMIASQSDLKSEYQYLGYGL